MPNAFGYQLKRIARFEPRRKIHEADEGSRRRLPGLEQIAGRALLEQVERDLD